jgi:hypothetical protein
MLQHFVVAALTTAMAGAVFVKAGPTSVSIRDGRWQLNGKVTYPRTPAEGLLLNVRMVNAVFEDANDATRPPRFDPDVNTRAFITALPEYAAQGVRAFTINLQGGDPKYEGAVNTAFAPDGSLRKSYLARVARVIGAIDRLEAVVILGCFLLPHFNNTPVEDIAGRAAALKKHGKPIVCNEDDKVGEEGAKAAEASVANGISWGFMTKTVNQHQPFRFNGAKDDIIVYAMLKRLTTRPKSGLSH